MAGARIKLIVLMFLALQLVSSLIVASAEMPLTVMMLLACQVVSSIIITRA